jgi:hypothetical protein
VTHPPTCSRARIGALLLCCVLLPALSGCSVWNRVFHRNRGPGCSEKPFALNTSTRPALKVPEGLSAPDTRNAVRIPDLSDHPERVRAKTEPCLAQPPSYFANPLNIKLPPPPPKPKRWYQFWRKPPPPPPPLTPEDATNIPGAPMTPMGPAPAPPPPPAPATK